MAEHRLVLDSPDPQAVETARKVLKMKHGKKNQNIPLIEIQRMAREVLRFDAAVPAIEAWAGKLNQLQLDRPSEPPLAQN